MINFAFPSSQRLSVSVFDHHWPVSFGLPLASRKSVTLSSASHSVHQLQPNILICRDDAERAAMLPAFSPSFQQAVALLCSTAHRCHYLMCSPCAPSSYAHTVNSLTVWFCHALYLRLLPTSLFISLILSLSPHKDFLAWSCCWLEHWSLTEVKQAFWDHREMWVADMVVDVMSWRWKVWTGLWDSNIFAQKDCDLTPLCFSTIISLI